MSDRDAESILPYASTVKFPSAEEWAKISKRIEDSILASGTVIDQDGGISSINNKLESMRIDMGFKSATLEDIVAFIRDFTNLNILIDAAVRDEIDMEMEIRFNVEDLVLKNVLQLLLTQFGLEYRITDEEVILISSPSGAALSPLDDETKKIAWDDLKNRLDQGQRAYNLGQYENAEREFQMARDVAKMLGSEPGADDVRTTSEDWLDRTRQARGQTSRDSSRRRIETRRELQTLFGQAQLNFEREEFKKCILLCDRILFIDPNLSSVQEMKMVCMRLRHMKSSRDNLAGYVEEWKRTFEEVELDELVQGQELKWADRHLWDEIRQRKPKSIQDDLDEDFVELGPGFVTNNSARLETYDIRAQTFHSLLKFDPLTGIGLDPISGRLVDQGTPEQVAAKSKSYTGQFLKSYLNGGREAKRKNVKGNSRKKKTARKRTTANKRKN